MIKRTRKQQVDGFIRRIKKLNMTLEDGMESACFVGACEERDHCLAIIDKVVPLYSTPGIHEALRHAICAKSVKQVLGYEKAK
jgi:hypothetical protein